MNGIFKGKLGEIMNFIFWLWTPEKNKHIWEYVGGLSLNCDEMDGDSYPNYRWGRV